MKNGGLPAPEVDLKYVAENVGYTSRNTCGNCHFYGGGGDAVKNPTMNSCLRYPDRMCDVHMGGYDFSCTDYVEFETLGYDGDPILTGGRFKQLPLALGSGTE